MTVRLDLKPDVEASLVAQARARGVSLDEYLRGFIEGLAQAQASGPGGIQDPRAALDALAEMGRDLPRLPSDALSREAIYRNRG